MDAFRGFDGNFYGTTCVSSSGTVFKVTPDGVMTRVHYFGTVLDGIQPLAGVVQATNGYLYGTTYLGGPNKYQGNNLTGATNVTFNDVPAVFTVVSPSLTATVPVGATTGKVRVTTPGGILSSDVDFRVVEPVTSGHTN